jgi:hypothetical protein
LSCAWRPNSGFASPPKPKTKKKPQ